MLTALLIFALSQSGSSVGPVPGVQIQDEGTSAGQITKLNCVGAGVTCARSGTTGTMTISGGAGNFGVFTVSFGSSADSWYDSDVTTVTAAWVGASSAILLTPKCSVLNGNNTADNCRVSGLSCTVVAVVNGVSFDVACHAPFTASGVYSISYTGG